MSCGDSGNTLLFNSVASGNDRMPCVQLAGRSRLDRNSWPCSFSSTPYVKFQYVESLLRFLPKRRTAAASPLSACGVVL